MFLLLRDCELRSGSLVGGSLRPRPGVPTRPGLGGSGLRIERNSVHDAGRFLQPRLPFIIAACLLWGSKTWESPQILFSETRTERQPADVPLLGGILWKHRTDLCQ